MTDNTVYTVVAANDRPGTSNSTGFFEKNNVTANEPGASTDSTDYSVVDTVDSDGAGNGTGSFFEKNSTLEALEFSDLNYLAIVAAAETATTQAGIATAAAADATAHDASAAIHDTNADASGAAAAASAATASTQATNASNSATAAAASATAAAGSATAAAGSATAAAGSASTASTQAGNASTSATAAAGSATAAAGSATAAAGSATAASGSASAASTSASNAATSEANALTYKNAANTSATNAATSEANALTYKNAANTSATNAATSETNAATSATNAAASLTDFKGRYYGALASDPTLDPNGNAVGAGDMYWNTTSSTLKIYSGSAWGAYSSTSVSTVFGRSGTVVAASGDYTFAQIGSKPTTLSGYGITDAAPIASPTFTGTVTAPITVTQLKTPLGGVSNWDTNFQAATTDTFSYAGESNGATNSPLTGWWFHTNMRHSNGSNYWGRQDAYGWEDTNNVNEHYTRNVSGGVFGPWVRYIHSNNYTSYAVSLTTSQTISGAKVYSKQQTYSLTTITDAANIAWDVNAAQKGKVTLGGNRTMNAVSNAVEGATYTLWVFQDGTGSRTISWTTTGAGSFDFGAAGAPTLTTTASKADLLSFEAVTIGGTLKLRYMGAAKGFT
jgi:hypothetical protein